MASSRIPSSNTPESSGNGGGGNSHTRPEEGDYIINWHLQYNAQVMLQYESQLRTLVDQIKAEINKMRVDADFIRHELHGPHAHLIRLNNEERDLQSVMEPISNLQELFRLVANRSSERIIN